MASSSSTSLTKISYDVFLSFRGLDTRHNFTSHLYAALARKHIHTFIDENDLDRGEEISPTLLKTIEESKISVIIFSENYGSSPWCRDELVKIMECTKTIGQKALPIFYNVDPSHVSDLTGNFGVAFKEEKEKFSNSKERVQKWCCALEEAADLSGWDSRNYRNEEELIGKIVEHIVQKLYPSPFTPSNYLVGMDAHIEKILPCLSMGSRDVRFIGLWGMGGIGKTTIAEVLYSHISCQFDRCYFFPSIREESEKNGPTHLRNRFLSQLLGIQIVNIEMLHVVPTYIKDSLSRLKVVVVLDDVSDPNQLEALGVDEGWFGPGSRIILTSRDKQVFNNVDEIYMYKVEGLNESNALKLFSMKAFKQKHPPEDDYAVLSRRVLHYAQGLPLALKVLGSHLCKRTPPEWEIELNKLNQFPDSTIQKILEISFEGLDDVLKDIFLYICCLKGNKKDLVIDILDGCGFPARWGINRLWEKCLITISGNCKLEMHDLVEEMGQEIARRKGRLYNNKDIIDISKKNKRNKTVECIVLNVAEVKNKGHFQFKALSWMPKLRLINISGRSQLNFESDNYPLCLSTNLRLLYWTYYPFESLPSKSFMENLVQLIMPRSKAKQLWDGNQCLPNLKILDLRYSTHLMRLPDLSSATKMEEIYLYECTSLEVLPPCIGTFKNLIILSMADCRNLRFIPSLIHSNSLRDLCLSGCLNLKILPEIPSSVQVLDYSESGVDEWPASLEYFLNNPCNGSFTIINLEKTAIRELPSSIRCFSASLQHLDMYDCKDLEILPHSLCELKCLETLDLHGCSKLSKLPPLKGLNRLELLYLNGSGIVEIPTDIVTLPSLTTLLIDNCKRLRCLPQLPWQLKELKVSDCSMLQAASIASIALIYLSNPTNNFLAIKGSYKFNFFNCTKLDYNARCKIMEDACWRVEEIAILPNVETRFNLYLPASEIPEWFSYQSEGNSMVVQLPHFTYPCYLTLAFCLVVENPCAVIHTDSLYYHCHCEFGYDSDKESRLFSDWSFIGVVNKSDHVLLWYSHSPLDTIEDFFSGKEASFQFGAQLGSLSNPDMKLRVKRCGVKWVVLRSKSDSYDQLNCGQNEDTEH